MTNWPEVPAQAWHGARVPVGMVRQSGTIALALALVWLLVLAEARGDQRGYRVGHQQASEQVEQVAAAAEIAGAPARITDAVAPLVAADDAGQCAQRSALRGIQLLI